MSSDFTRRSLLLVGGGTLVGGGALSGTYPLGTLPQAAAAGAASEQPAECLTEPIKSRILTIGDAKIRRIYHDENLLPDTEHAGFSSLLYDSAGKLVLHDGNKTWLYSSGLFEAPTGGQRDWYGKWVSDVREFDTKTLKSGEKKLALGLDGDDEWAVIHDVVKVSDHLFVAFYSTNPGVRAAVSDRPDGLFQADRGFEIAVTERWERRGGKEDSLESNGGHVKIHETSRHLSLWLMYDSYHVDKTRGKLGWAKVRIDKRTREVELMGKHTGNPLTTLPKNYIAARCGGNLSSDVRLGGKHVLFYYTRPNKNIIMLTAALSSDPLFQHITDVVEFEYPLGTEDVMEKFETYMLGGVLHIVYENQLASGHWGTGIRRYEFVE